MTTDEKLAAILAAVQTDPGNRGLARDQHDNLFTATKGDFEAACRSIAEHPDPLVAVVTGFFIPSADPPAFETDGPLGAGFVMRALAEFGIQCALNIEAPMGTVIYAALRSLPGYKAVPISRPGTTHILSIERAGPAADGNHYTMRGRDVSEHLPLAGPLENWLALRNVVQHGSTVTAIGIGDGGNEIGMGKIPHETIVKNIPNGDLIHCRVPTDHLIVAGVSNWGAYALAAGVYVLRGVKPPADLFDPDRERAILEVMVREGPLVDGVTGKQTATVDGLTWDEYAKPLVRIREILES
jgi:D-glutamate cyclase